METQFFKSASISERTEKACRNIRQEHAQIYRNIRKEVNEYKATLSGHPTKILEAGKAKHRELTELINQRKNQIVHTQCQRYQISVPFIQKVLDPQY